MSTQFRTQADPRLYDANRDLAHNFDQVVGAAVESVVKGRWPALNKLLADQGVEPRHLGDAFAALGEFVATQAGDPREGMHDALTRSGFYALPEAARIGAAAYLGTVVLGMHWFGVRSATLNAPGAHQPAELLRGQRWCGVRCQKLMTLPRWRRLLYLGWRRVRKAWRVFTR